MKQRFLLLAIVASLALPGCASMKKQGGGDGDEISESSGEDAFDGADEDGDTSTATVAPSKNSPMAEARPTRAVDKKYQALSQALRSGREESVVSEASKILAANGSDPVALNALAMFQFKQGRIGAARILLDKAFEKVQNNASLLNNLALIQIAEGDNSGAMQTLKKAYRIDEGNPDVCGNLGSLYVQGGDYNKALPLLETAYRANKTNVNIATNYAIALRGAKNFDKAAKIYDDLVKTHTRDVGLHLNYAILLIDYMGKLKEGLPYATKVKFLETERKDILDRANALEKKARGELK